MADMNDFNRQVIEEFRANGGKVGGNFEGAQLLLLQTTGAKSGQPRIAPLVYRAEADGLVIAASKAGAPTNPDWFHNIRANPKVHVEVGPEEFDGTARILEGAERDQQWERHKAELPGFADYEAATDRVIPMVLITRDS